MTAFTQKYAWLKSICLISFCGFGFSAYAEPSRKSPSPSPLPKSVQTSVDSNPDKIDVVGVQATDPAQNGKPITNGSLSPTNASSIGVGIQLHFGAPAKASQNNDDNNKNDEDPSDSKK